MPALTTPAKVLVTGASGFLASHVASQLVSAGYDVVGTVRGESKGKFLENLFRDSKGSFSFVVVRDIEAGDAFDDAVKGVDAIMHIASPIHTTGEDPSEYIGPAVSGTLNALKSAARPGSSVKRIVITGSLGSVFSPVSTKPPGHNFTEADWNTGSLELIKELGSKATFTDKYFGSKTLAEKAAWDWYEQHKSEVGFDLTVVHPSWVSISADGLEKQVFGPIIHEVASVDALNTSNAYLYGAVKHPLPADSPELVRWQGGFVDVRDAAHAHILAMEKEDAKGKRFILTSELWCIADVYNVLRTTNYPNAPAVRPSISLDKSKWATQDSTQAKTILGISFRPFDETVVDTLNSINSRFA